MSWLSTDSMSKLPKDWQPPPKPSEDIPSYVEVKEIQSYHNCLYFSIKVGLR